MMYYFQDANLLENLKELVTNALNKDTLFETINKIDQTIIAVGFWEEAYE